MSIKNEWPCFCKCVFCPVLYPVALRASCLFYFFPVGLSVHIPEPMISVFRKSLPFTFLTLVVLTIVSFKVRRASCSWNWKKLFLLAHFVIWQCGLWNKLWNKHCTFSTLFYIAILGLIWVFLQFVCILLATSKLPGQEGGTNLVLRCL